MPHLIPCKMFSISILLFVSLLHSCFALIIQKGQTSTNSPLHHFSPVLPSIPSTTTLSPPSQKISRDVKSSTILDAFKISQNTIIRTKESRSLGARYLNESQTSSREECLTWCWKVAGCNLAVFEEQGHRSCYLFDCGSPDDFKCKFTPHESYTTSLLNRASLDLDEWRAETDHENDLILLRSTPSSSHINSQITSRSLESTTDFSETSAIKTQKKESSCQRFQFQCKNSTECIAIYNVCDGIPQCSDGSDELHCDTRSQITEGGDGASSSLSSSVSRSGKSVEEEEETEMMRKKMQEVHQQQQHQASLSSSSSSSKSPSPVKSISQGQGNSELESPSMFHYPKVPSEGTFLKEPQTPPQAPLSSFFQRKPYSSYLSNSQLRVPESIGPQNSQQPPPISQSFLPPQQQESSFSNNYYGNYPYMIPADFYGQGEVKPGSKILPPNSGSYVDSGPLFWPVMSPDNTRVNNLDSQAAAVETGVSNGALIGQEKLWRQKLERYQSSNLFNNIANAASDSRIVSDRFHKLPNPISDEITKTTTVKPQIPELERNSQNEKESPKGIMMSKLKAPSLLSHADAIAVTHLRDSDPSGRDTNSAVIALTLGLSITAMLIGLVGCRMNSIKKKIARRGGRGLAHDADYLVNGMYL